MDAIEKFDYIYKIIVYIYNIFMNLQYIRYFIILAETKHYTKAAELIGISQPSLSHAIRELEKELGLPLFDPGHRTELTQWGERFLASARSSLSMLSAGIHDMRMEAEGRGHIRLGFLRVLGTDCIPKLASSYKEENPDVSFSFSSGRTDELISGIHDSSLDIAFTAIGEGDDLISRYLFSMELVAVFPSSHPLAGKSTVSLVDTADYPFLQYSEGAALRTFIDDEYRKIGRSPIVAYESQEAPVLAGLAGAGFGFAIMFRDEVPPLDDIVTACLSPRITVPIYAAVDSRRMASPTTLSFLDYISGLDLE